MDISCLFCILHVGYLNYQSDTALGGTPPNLWYPPAPVVWVGGVVVEVLAVMIIIIIIVVMIIVVEAQVQVEVEVQVVVMIPY